MIIQVKVDISAFTRFHKRMESELDATTPGPYQEGLLKASDIYHEAMRKRFLSASLGDGTWAPLAPVTVKAHALIGDDLPHVLHMEGDLERSLKRGEADHVEEIIENGIREGTEDDKARFHQDGNEPKMPARPILVYPGDDILSDMKDAIAKGIQQSVHANSSQTLASGTNLGALFGIDLI